MNEVIAKSLNLMYIAVPTMFAVTLLFIGATIALHKAFPAEDEKE